MNENYTLKYLCQLYCRRFPLNKGKDIKIKWLSAKMPAKTSILGNIKHYFYIQTSTVFVILYGRVYLTIRFTIIFQLVSKRILIAFGLFLVILIRSYIYKINAIYLKGYMANKSLLKDC